MGFMDRLKSIAKGAGSMIVDNLDATWDVATASFGRPTTGVDADDLFGAIGDVFGAATKYGGRYVAKPLARYAKYTLVDSTVSALGLFNTLYREGIAEPISTAFTFGSLLDDPQFQKRMEGKSLLERVGATFSEADDIAEHRSPGQALLYAITTKSITDEDEIAQIDDVLGKDDGMWSPYNLSTGLTDAALNIVADPTVVVSKTARGLRGVQAAREVRALAEFGEDSKAGREIADLVRTKIDEVGAERAPAAVRSRLFASPTARDGDAAAHLLVQAAVRGGDELDLTLRTFAGSAEANERLIVKATDLADAAATHMRTVSGYVDVNTVNGTRSIQMPQTPDAIRDFNIAYKAARDANAELTNVEALNKLQGIWEWAPKVTVRGAIRETYTRSQLYQSSPFMRPMRIVNGFKPRRALNVHTGNLDVHIARALDEIGAPLDVRDVYRSRMQNPALTAGGRRAVVDEVNDYIVNKVADDIGLSGALRAKYLDEVTKVRGESAGVPKTLFSDADGVDKLVLVDESGVPTVWQAPALSAHLSNYAFLPNTKRLNHLATRVKRDLSRGTATEIADDALAQFYAVWKPITLFGLRTPIRVGSEELARRMTDYGAIAVGSDVARQLGSKVGLTTRAGEDVVRGATRQFEAAFEGVGGRIARGELAETASVRGPFYGQTVKGLYDDVEGLREWVSIPADDVARFDPAWEHAANAQLGSAPLARRIMESGMDTDAVVDWLKTGEGYRLLRTADEARILDPEGWVDEVAAQIEHVLPTEELRAAALRGEAKVGDLLALFDGDRALAPSVHGQYLDEALTGKSAAVAFMRKANDRLMTTLNGYPTIFLNREPHFARKYAQEVLRLERVALERGIDLTDDLARTIEKRARTYALEQTRELLFDMAEHSNLAESLRFAAPFANATREVATRWAGIAWRKPETIRRLQQVWSAPEKAGLIVDGNGNVVLGDGKSRTAEGEIVATEGEQYFKFALPSWAPVPKAMKEVVASTKFSKDAFNTIIANPWGVGPLVTAAGSLLIKDRPDVQENVKFLFPFGVPDSVAAALTPNVVRNIPGGEDDRGYAASRLYYFNSLYAEWAQDGEPLAEGETKRQRVEALWKNASAAAKQTESIRWFASFLLPVKPSFGSAYQPYIDIYRRYQDEDPREARVRFIEDYGVELTSLTTSLTKSVAGVPPTLEGWKAYEKYKPLIDANPEVGSLIVGELGGEFNRAVYNMQLRKGQRVLRTKQEIVGAADIEAGWHEYTKIMDAVDAERVNRGLPNLQVKAAEGLAKAKAAAVDALSEKYPAWREDKDTIDLGRQRRRIDTLRQLTQEPLLQDRPDFQGIAAYIQARDIVVAILRQREEIGGASTLEARANSDLLAKWRLAQAYVAERYVQFSPIFYRWFENDMPKADDGT